MTLFPYIFARVGGGPLNDLEHLKYSEKLKDAIKEVLASDKVLEQIRLEVVTFLYHMIQTEKDTRIQNNLLNLKRAIYNNKTIASLAFFYDSYLKELKENKLNKLLVEYAQCYENRNSATATTTTLFKQEIDEAIRSLDTLCQANYLSNGFLFASEKLSRAVGEPSFYKKQKEKTVFSLLKYLTRSVAKSTPFSTFNTVVCLAKEKVRFLEMHPVKESNVNPSNLVFLYIKKWLIFLPESRYAFKLSINSSIVACGEFYHFFINQDNHEFLKRIRRTQMCNLIKNFLDENPIMTYSNLVSFLREQTAGSTAEVSTYIDNLITEGFIIFQFPASLYDAHWPARLVRFINNEISVKNDFILTTISTFLVNLSESKQNLESSKSPVDRKKYLSNLNSELLALTKLLMQKYPSSPFHHIIERIPFCDMYYEDVVGVNPIKFKPSDFENFTEKLSGLRGSLTCFDERMSIRQSIKAVLINEFGGKPVALLNFLEIYFSRKDKFESEAYGKLLALIQSPNHFYFRVIQAVENCKEDELDLQRIPQSHHSHKCPAGYGLYAQITGENGDPVLIINGESSGYGKNFSRFLGYFDPKVNFEIIEQLTADHPDAIIADVHDASIHNTNRYPAFTDYQIEIPGHEPDPRPNRRIPLTDLYLKIDCDDVILILKDGQKVIPFNFSMESVTRKSTLIKFFDLFGVSSPQSLLIMEIANKYFAMRLKQSEKMITVIPRILYGRNIVLGRRKWLVKKGVFSDVLTSSYDKFSLSSYLKIEKWRTAHYIPDEVFVKTKGRDVESYSAYKPQYINFEVPLLVACFISLLQDAEEVIEITEMLPDSHHLKEKEEVSKHVQEFVLNYN